MITDLMHFDGIIYRVEDDVHWMVRFPQAGGTAVWLPAPSGYRSEMPYIRSQSELHQIRNDREYKETYRGMAESVRACY